MMMMMITMMMTMMYVESHLRVHHGRLVQDMCLDPPEPPNCQVFHHHWLWFKMMPWRVNKYQAHIFNVGLANYMMTIVAIFYIPSGKAILVAVMKSLKNFLKWCRSSSLFFSFSLVVKYSMCPFRLNFLVSYQFTASLPIFTEFHSVGEGHSWEGIDRWSSERGIRKKNMSTY